ncbi:unnamed protein product [Paramecium primaurelia]|uniref:Transmembrane protein n=1 Tax=Paramecium primaurelia TaxID=5886 RepID=A0A8S1KH79_PARPR|nr:unnamed protein product [Paramecium primaurelia]
MQLFRMDSNQIKQQQQILINVSSIEQNIKCKETIQLKFFVLLLLKILKQNQCLILLILMILILELNQQ